MGSNIDLFTDRAGGADFSGPAYTTIWANAYEDDPRFTKISPKTAFGALTVYHTIHGTTRNPASASESLILLSNQLPRRRIALRLNLNDISKDCVGSAPGCDLLAFRDLTPFGIEAALTPFLARGFVSVSSFMTEAFCLTGTLLQHFAVTEAEAFVVTGGRARALLEGHGLECPPGMALMELVETIKGETGLLDDFPLEDMRAAIAGYFLGSAYEDAVFRGEDPSQAEKEVLSPSVTPLPGPR